MTTTTQKTVTEMSVSELLDANRETGNGLDQVGPSTAAWKAGHSRLTAKELLVRRRQIRAELNKRHETNS